MRDVSCRFCTDVKNSTVENFSYTSADLSKVVNWTEFWTDPGNPRTHLVGGKGEML